MLTAPELYRRLDQIVPGYGSEGPAAPFAESPIVFERLSMTGLDEMHRYSIDQRLYEFFEFKPFAHLSETKAYIERLQSRMTATGLERTAMYWFVRRRT